MTSSLHPLYARMPDSCSRRTSKDDFVVKFTSCAYPEAKWVVLPSSSILQCLQLLRARLGCAELDPFRTTFDRSLPRSNISRPGPGLLPSDLRQPWTHASASSFGTGGPFAFKLVESNLEFATSVARYQPKMPYSRPPPMTRAISAPRGGLRAWEVA